MQKLRHIPEIVIDLGEDAKIIEFLASQKKSTSLTYTSYLRRLKEFTTETGSEMLVNRKIWVHKIFEFQHYLEERKYSGTYVQSCTGCIRGYFEFHRKPLQLTKQEKKRLGKRSRSTEDFYFTLENLKTMSQFCGNLKEKFVLVVGKSLGFRSCDFVTLNYGQLRGVESELDHAPVFLGEIRAQKEDTKYFAFLDVDACEVIRQILNANRDKSDNESVLMTYSKKFREYRTMHKAELSVILQSIAKRANIQNGNKRIHFHLLRKFLSNHLSSYMSSEKWKQITAKQISESAYIGTESLREDYSRAMPSFALSGNGQAVKQKVSDLESENKKLKARIRELEENIRTYESDKNSMQKMLDSQTMDILEIQTKLGIKPKPIRSVD